LTTVVELDDQSQQQQQHDSASNNHDDDDNTVAASGSTETVLRRLRRRVRRAHDSSSSSAASAAIVATSPSSSLSLSPSSSVRASNASLERGESGERRKRLSFHRSPDGRQSPTSLFQLCMVEIGRDLDQYIDDIPLLGPVLVDQLITFVVTNLQPTNQVVLDASVTLRVRFPDGRFLTMRFNTAQSVHETKSQIFARFAPDTAPGVTMQQYALFQPAGAFTQPRWLLDERSLSFYDLRPGEEIEFKQKQCLVRSKFLSPWETTKAFIVDGTLPVHQLAETIATKLGLEHPDEFSFFKILVASVCF
jgi:hypothetical protein